MDPAKIIIVLFVLVYSCILHEIAHAWVALKLGDSTAKDLGRITLNPIPHIDPFMTILVPALLYFSTRGTFCFGGAKPVPIDANRFRHPGRGMLLSAAAGPITNFILALVGAVILIGICRASPEWIYRFSTEGAPQLTYNGFLLAEIVLLNGLLGTFNMIPIPPLDGSRVLRYLLPYGGKRFLDRMERFGLLVLMLFIYLGGNFIIAPIYDAICIVLRIGMGADGYEALLRAYQ